MAKNFGVTTENMSTSTQTAASTTEPWTVTRHPAVLQLSSRDRRLGNFGLTLFVISQAIPYFVLVNVRWMMAGGYIPANLNHQLGGLWPTILLAVGTVLVSLGVEANRNGKTGRLQSSFTASAVLGVAAIVLMLIPLWVHGWTTFGHYESIYVICQGVAVFYTIVAVIVVLGVVFRAGTGIISPQTSFGPQSAAVVYTFNAIAWFGLYVTLYLV
ncbi:hypothetical protein [Alicyclobacillus sp. ALC3]|uniref:hypothetical protein n=1 Tax=Alicyclobacillus sp. ALC3 TaxID=2796143 RepID=UPI0023788B66|nr:hypothetical protein [Alicyclobacillus sp. ALC3]WDL96115.1 hypothetical protein JC200_17495 [Alicyclobacillus sp. ALC3]